MTAGVLRLDAVRKVVVAGVAGCLARARVLDRLSLQLRAGEFVAVVGAPASGKSTLLLCAAGLARCDDGHVFRDAGRCYLRAADLADPRVRARAERARLLLLDDADSGAALLFAVASCARGVAVLAAGRDPARFAAAGARVFELRDGRLREFAPLARAYHPIARVAEPGRALR